MCYVQVRKERPPSVRAQVEAASHESTCGKCGAHHAPLGALNVQTYNLLCLTGSQNPEQVAHSYVHKSTAANVCSTRQAVQPGSAALQATTAGAKTASVQQPDPAAPVRPARPPLGHSAEGIPSAASYLVPGIRSNVPAALRSGVLKVPPAAPAFAAPQDARSRTPRVYSADHRRVLVGVQYSGVPQTGCSPPMILVSTAMRALEDAARVRRRPPETTVL
jgi:hypothetical protein